MAQDPSRSNHVTFFGGLLLFLGLLMVLSPLFFWWYVSDYDRYIAMIRGPFPFSHFGSGPLQLWGAVFLLGWGATVGVTGLAAFRSGRLLARDGGLRALQALGFVGMGALTLPFLSSPIIVLVERLSLWLR